jgi:cobalamin biosynthesis protein CbiD
MSPDSFEIHSGWPHESVLRLGPATGRAAAALAAAAAATTVTGSGLMHLQVTTLNETSAQTRTTAVRRRGTTNSAGGLDDSET